MTTKGEEWEDEFAGEPSQQEIEKEQQVRQAGSNQTLGPGGTMVDDEEQNEDPSEIGRPKPGPLGRGSLGPRMKSFTSRLRKVLANGNGRH